MQTIRAPTLISVPFRSPHLSYLALPLDKVVPGDVNVPTTSSLSSLHDSLLVESMASFITTSSVDPTYPTYPVVASIGIILILLPAYWHFKSGNVGTIIFIVWNFLGNLNYLVNSIAWAENLHNPPWIWCDFSSALIIALNVAMPTSSLLISRRLYSIANVGQMNSSRNNSRRTKYLEIAVGIGLPLLAVILRVVVQGHRFDIIENVGCWPSVYSTPVTIPTVFLPPILINVVSAYYSGLAIQGFLNQRKQFSSIVKSANSGLTTGRYFRLMALASTEIIFSVPMSTYVMVNNIKSGMHPWISWADTHLDFNRVEILPFGFFRLFPRSWILVNLTRYSLPLNSLLFFIYLGMSGEPGIFYRRQFWRLACLLGFPVPSADTSPQVSWITRPGVRVPSRLRSLPPFVTSVSVTSTPKKKQLSLQLNAYGTGSRSDSSSGSLSVPPDPKVEKELAHDSWLGLALSAEVHSSVV